MADNKRLILAYGEKYTEPVYKKGSGREPELPRTYDEARSLVKQQLSLALQEVATILPSRRIPDEMFLCLRIHPDFIPKSYEPQSIFTEVRQIEKVGSRNWYVNPKEVAQTRRVASQLAKQQDETVGRIIFVRGDETGFKSFLDRLDASDRV